MKERPIKLSVVIPAHNEEESVPETVESLIRTLTAEGIDHEIVAVNDSSTDRTEAVLQELQGAYPTLRYTNNPTPNGFGLAVRKGLEHATGDAVAIVMGDGSDSPQDVVRCFRKLQEGYECVFGSRFIKGSRVTDYPPHKLLINRLANLFVKVIFALSYNDVTNAFKCYRREVIEGAQPLISTHFNLTVELPLKAIIRGYSYTVIPISWTNRKTGISKLKLREMGSRYLFIVLYLFLEKHLSQGDYRRVVVMDDEALSPRGEK
jgi:dolichol-phosphate mannosyltransferase